MTVCLFFPFENLELELINPDDEMFIRGFRSSIINIIIKYKLIATKTINRILNPLYCVNDLKGQERKNDGGGA